MVLLLYRHKYNKFRGNNMSNAKLNLKAYMNGDKKDFTKDAKKLEKKTPKNQFMGSGSKFPAAWAGIHETLLSEIMGGGIGALSDNANTAAAYYQNNWEEDEENTSGGANTTNKIDLARQLFQAVINRPDATRKGIIQQFIDEIGVTQSTAVSYYERLAKEAGLTGSGDGDQDIGAGNGMEEDPAIDSGFDSQDDMPIENDPDEDEDVDPNRAGIIRTVDNAHLIYKRRDEEGQFEELWQYNTNDKIGDELEIRRNILAGTDIPPKKTRSPDGSQKYTLTTLGNAQYVNITGLVN